jgi:hypothetical protein
MTTGTIDDELATLRCDLTIRGGLRARECEEASAVFISHLSLWFRFKRWLKEPFGPSAVFREQMVTGFVAQAAAEEILHLRARIADLKSELAKLKG